MIIVQGLNCSSNLEKMSSGNKKVCVTGGTGFIASTLIKQLLEKGYHVHTTVRDPENLSKVSHLKKLDTIGGTLKLFRADLREEGSFDEAVSGCDYVFHVASPVDLTSDDPENAVINPAIQGTLAVMRSCMKAKTVKRIVYTSSGAAVSVNQLEGTGLVVNEESWSDIEFLYAMKPPSWGYIVSKTLAEKAAWKFAQENKIDLVTIIPVLTIGPVLSEAIPLSMRLLLSLFTGDERMIGSLKAAQETVGVISLVHVVDVCRAHIFAAETESASGRYICAAVNTSLPELAAFLSKRYPQYKVPTDFSDVPAKAKLIRSSEKLVSAGFEFKYKTLEDIFDETIEYFKNVGLLAK